MTASSHPDENSYSPKDAGSNEPMESVYDDPNAPQSQPTESTYVPEREFVLMPLFRRIGELLGIRRQSEPEYIYEAGPEAPQQDATLAHEEANFGREELIPPHEVGHLEVADVEPAAEWPEPPAFEPMPDLPSAPEPIALQATAIEPEARTYEPSAEIEATNAHFAQQTSEPIALHGAEAELPQTPAYEPLEQLEASSAHFEPLPQHGPEVETQVSQTPPNAVVAPRSVQPPQRRMAPRRKDEIDEAIAILREASSKVSHAIAEAVEWLSAKENELVRKAERSLAPAPKVRRVQTTARSAAPRQPVQNLASVSDAAVAESTPAIPPDSPAVPKWEPRQFPGLQREVAWREEAGTSAAEQPLSKAQPPRPSTYSEPGKRRPTLVRPRPRVPFWKRIDWAREFTPKRVAVLGGVTMAMVLVAGVTLARRPASEVLPPQPRTIQPGGVTLTTRPTATAGTAPAQQRHRATSRAPRQAAAAPHRARRAAAYDEEPDVVTHYYKQKPSPTKQATVAGVKHYSDLN